jgi:hypothetical protein
MKPVLFLLTIICLNASAQSGFNDSIADSRRRIDLSAMTFLGSFGVANIATGFILANNTTGEASRFWRMNAYWGIVNTGIAAINLIHLRSIAAKKFDFAANTRAQQVSERIYLLNFGLDITYITAGLLLASKAKTESDPVHRDESRGYGKSIALQGLVLLVMDGIVLRLHHQNTLRMNDRLQKWEISAAPGGLGLSLRFGGRPARN